MASTATRSATTSAATESLVRRALELHRSVLAAEDVQHLPSPASPVEKNSKGAADPTASTALDTRRVAVVDALKRTQHAAASLGDSVQDVTRDITAALDEWDGK